MSIKVVVDFMDPKSDAFTVYFGAGFGFCRAARLGIYLDDISFCPYLGL